MKKILIINGSYRDNGITDQMVSIAEQALTDAEVEVVLLRELPIEFCINCRQCTQVSGTALGQCIHDDNMSQLIAKIEASDAFILASPTNFGSVTAIFKRFQERLTVYADWPWGQFSPKMRRPINKKALLLSSCAAPAILARWQFNTIKQLKMTARVLGAKTTGSTVIGMIAQQPITQISKNSKKKIQRLALRLT